MIYLSASAVVIHYEEALYQVYAPLPFTFNTLHFTIHMFNLLFLVVPYIVTTYR